MFSFPASLSPSLLINVSSLQVHRFDFRSKCIYVAVIIRRMMDAMMNRDAVDDRVGGGLSRPAGW